MGEIDLLEQDGVSARKNFEIAQTTDEHLPNLQPDLAAAWFEIGDKTGNAEAYAEAAELYSKALHDNPADPALLLYNRALSWERQNLVDNALDDLNSALKVERSASWRKSIEAEIQRIKSPHVSGNSSLEDDDYETALDSVTRNLLPQWNSSPAARIRIKKVAAVGLRHHDYWLQDWIDAPHTSLSQEADTYLAKAVAEGNIRDAEASLVDARKASVLYRTLKEYPGIYRAKVVEVYDLEKLAPAREYVTEIAELAVRQISGATHGSLFAWRLKEPIVCRRKVISRNNKRV